MPNGQAYCGFTGSKSPASREGPALDDGEMAHGAVHQGRPRRSSSSWTERRSRSRSRSVRSTAANRSSSVPTGAPSSSRVCWTKRASALRCWTPCPSAVAPFPTRVAPSRSPHRCPSPGHLGAHGRRRETVASGRGEGPQPPFCPPARRRRAGCERTSRKPRRARRERLSPVSGSFRRSTSSWSSLPIIDHRRRHRRGPGLPLRTSANPADVLIEAWPEERILYGSSAPRPSQAAVRRPADRTPCARVHHVRP